MKNVKDLRNELDQVFSNLKNNNTDVGKAKAMVATTNAILKSLQLELEQNKLINKKEAIDWLT